MKNNIVITKKLNKTAKLSIAFSDCVFKTFDNNYSVTYSMITILRAITKNL